MLQEQLFQEPWRVLIVFDALRFDVAHEVNNSFKPCDSLVTDFSVKCLTTEWTKLFLKGQEGSFIHFFSASPANYFGSKQADNVKLFSLWESEWKDGTVKPEDMSNSVIEYVREVGQPEKLVVFFLQPHRPYIQAKELEVEFGPVGMDDAKIGDLLEGNPELLKSLEEAYTNNFLLAYEEANKITAAVKGPVLLTSDHGEFLGENGNFGHAVDDTVLGKIPFKWR